MTWEQVVRDAASKPYKIGEHDCWKFACSIIEARTGKQFYEDGAYATVRSALRYIRQNGVDLPDAVGNITGLREIGVLQAQRGDIVAYKDSMHHLGVCLGEWVVMLGADGLVELRITDSRLLCAWRVE